jgi:hypothetical protein
VLKDLTLRIDAKNENSKIVALYYDSQAKER